MRGTLQDDRRKARTYLSSPKDLFVSPDWYPLKMDFERRYVTFVHMSQTAYRESTFHASRAAHRYGKDAIEIRLDDILLAAADIPAVAKPVHFILHCGLCCSTLLTRYLDLLPSSVVMKEPHLLTQLALARNRGIADWQEIFDLSLRLLTRTYGPAEIATIKTNIPCNPLGTRFLQHSQQATLTFVMISIRDFMLAVLKDEYRRGLVRFWNRDLSDNATGCALPFADIQTDKLSVEQHAACFWLRTRFLCDDLASGRERSRVMVLNGQRIADSPRDVLSDVAGRCGRTVNEEQLRWLIDHPSVHQHSKNTSRRYDAQSRRNELEELQQQYGKQIDAALDWAMSFGINPDWLTIPETDAVIGQA